MSTVSTLFHAPLDVRHAFTQGDCGYLAFHIARMTNFTPVTASIDTPGEWYHAGVLTPDNMVLDIDGLNEIDQWLNYWLDGEEGEEHFLAQWDITDFRNSVFEDARHFPKVSPTRWARKLLAAFDMIG